MLGPLAHLRRVSPRPSGHGRSAPASRRSARPGAARRPPCPRCEASRSWAGLPNRCCCDNSCCHGCRKHLISCCGNPGPRSLCIVKDPAAGDMPQHARPRHRLSQTHDRIRGHRQPSAARPDAVHAARLPRALPQLRQGGPVPPLPQDLGQLPLVRRGSPPPPHRRRAALLYHPGRRPFHRRGRPLPREVGGPADAGCISPSGCR